MDNPNYRFGPISMNGADQAEIRYTAEGKYEIKMPGQAWDTLIHARGSSNTDADNIHFELQNNTQNNAYLFISRSRARGYSYSELGHWWSAAAGRSGELAFGVPTPAGGVPTTGSASFNGELAGRADVLTFDGGLCGCYFTTPVDGTVTLNFDFANGTLGGSMNPHLNDYMNPRVNLGTFTFRNTVFAAGSTTYSGAFNTPAAGQNFFTGRFTGPNAQETIGAWALPFNFTVGGAGLPADNQSHQAFGAWIAKRP